ncbi:MAG: glycosyltransferase family 4 protein [Patescibacteria group bacterium]|nr:glycosyltransferase family 4 protein [Patescibacteria group bacterium]MCL5431749.1 glycosyltransferase family 4 protein [Patescibacteria group bacterium]
MTQSKTIAVDAAPLNVSDDRLKVGVYRVAKNLLGQLQQLDRKNTYRLYDRPSFAWRYLELPLSLLWRRPDVFLGISQALPVFCPCPSVVIFHDLGFETYPQHYVNPQRIQSISRQAAAKATKIIAVSTFTKNQLTKIYQVPPEKITVAYEGVDPIFKPVRRRITAGQYFLFIGSLKKTKNVPRIIAAFKKFHRRHPSYKLVLAGSDFWPDRAIKKTPDVINLGFVSDTDLPALYSHAAAFVSPSLFEGFGLTLVEAMTCGCPAVAGKNGAEPEVVGDAGLLVNPLNVNEIAVAMEKMLDPKLTIRLRSRSLSRAKLFSWEKFAKEVLGVIESVT